MTEPADLLGLLEQLKAAADWPQAISKLVADARAVIQEELGALEAKRRDLDARERALVEAQNRAHQDQRAVEAERLKLKKEEDSIKPGLDMLAAAKEEHDKREADLQRRMSEFDERLAALRKVTGI